MKFITNNFKFIALVVLITLSATSAAKINALSKDGGGDWDNGFLCPNVHIDGIKLGEVTVFAKKIESNEGEDKFSMLLKFTKAPANLDIIRKVGRDIGSNQWRIAYRKTLNSFIYVNPSGNKYIQGTVQDEQGNQFSFKLILPWKLFGWYIDDNQGNRIKNAINNKSTARTSAVISAKYQLRKNYQSYFDAKKEVEALSKNKDEYTKYMQEKKTQLATLKLAITGLRSSATDAQTNVNAKHSDLLEANAKLDELLAKESQIATQKSAIDESVETLSKGTPDLEKTKADLTKSVNDAKKNLDAEYASLLKNAPQRTADINASKTNLYALKKVEYQANLNKIYS